MEHYTQYAPTKRVTKEDFPRRIPAKPFVEPVASPWSAPLPPGSLPKLIMGFKAEIMDHKWHVYTDGPDDSGILTVHFIRSWTGIPVVAAKIQAELDDDKKPILENRARIVEITWEAADNRRLFKDEISTEESSRKWVVDVCDWVFGIHVPLEGDDEPWNLVEDSNRVPLD